METQCEHFLTQKMTLQTMKDGLYLSESLWGNCAKYPVNTTILSTFLWPCANPRHSNLPKSLVSRLPCLPLRRRLPMADLRSCQCKQDTETHCSLQCWHKTCRCSELFRNHWIKTTQHPKFQFEKILCLHLQDSVACCQCSPFNEIHKIPSFSPYITWMHQQFVYPGTCAPRASTAKRQQSHQKSPLPPISSMSFGPILVGIMESSVWQKCRSVLLSTSSCQWHRFASKAQLGYK